MRLLLPALLLFMGSSAPLRAEEPVTVSRPEPPSRQNATSTSSAGTKNENQQPANPPPRQAHAPPSGKAAGKAAGNDKPVFVDRDGDGINDGQEHRFRGRHRRGKRRGWSRGAAGGSQRRHRARGGPQ